MKKKGCELFMGILKIALPKGRMAEDTFDIFEKIGIKVDWVRNDKTRRLIFTDHENGFQFILAKPRDVPTYVEYGAADIGVVGKDTLMESGRSLPELVDLGIGRCKLIVAVLESTNINTFEDIPFGARIATEYPYITDKFFSSKGMQVDIIKLRGSMELAPVVGLADAIVDITETGITLKENKLKPIGEISESTARLVANRVSYNILHDRIKEITKSLKEVVKCG